MYDLEAQKRDLKARLEVAESLRSTDAAELEALHAALLERETALKERERLLKVAAGRARAEVLSMKTKMAEEKAAAAAGTASGDLIPAAPAPPVFMSPGKTAHVDVATLQSMLRAKEKELGVLREDNAAKEGELMRALELLQGAHKREGELTRQVASLGGQLELAREELRERQAAESEEDSVAAALNTELEGMRAEVERLEAEVVELQELLEEARAVEMERQREREQRGGFKAAVGVARVMMVARGVVGVAGLLAGVLGGGGR